MQSLHDVKVSLDCFDGSPQAPGALRAAIAKELGCAPEEVGPYEVTRRSLDARQRDLYFIIGVNVYDSEEDVPPYKPAQLLPAELLTKPSGSLSEEQRPVVVGAGPAGLFAALALAQAGLRPLVIERGDAVDERQQQVAHFMATGNLNFESNVQFGEGGAGTFSDGKLSTGTHSSLVREVLKAFVEAGAPQEITVLSKPHIGTDELVKVVKGLRQRICNLGGEFFFNTRLVGLELEGGSPSDGSRGGSGAGDFGDLGGAGSAAVSGLSVVRSSGGAGNQQRIKAVCVQGPQGAYTIPTQHLIVACGHSARDTFEMLAQRGVLMELKPFAIGVRIEHSQARLNKTQYKKWAGHPALSAADYKFVTHLANGRNVYSFCMCPGGQVIAAASEANQVVTNGMSLHARAGANANAGLLVNVTAEDVQAWAKTQRTTGSNADSKGQPGSCTLPHPSHPLVGVAFQQAWEQAAFEAGGGGYQAPAQLWSDFLQGVPSSGPGSINPTYTRGVSFGSLDTCLPSFVLEGLRGGMENFDKKMRFAAPDAVLTGVETRSSSPVRILRDKESFQSNIKGLYPTGEGAGYAGGIVSAAVDGCRVAAALVQNLLEL